MPGSTGSAQASLPPANGSSPDEAGVYNEPGPGRGTTGRQPGNVMSWFNSWSSSPAESWLDDQRQRMVDHQIRRRGVHDGRVLAAMQRVPRHVFVPESARHEAYDDRPLVIGFEQTISQPYIVAKMTELAECGPGDRVLEIGTGSGYQTAILGELASAVYTVERIEALLHRAERALREQGYDNVAFRLGDGFAGWPEEAPFDAIVVTAAPADVPVRLKEQLADGGRLVVPVGEERQDLLVLRRRGDEWTERSVIPVRFVPMIAGATDAS